MNKIRIIFNTEEIGAALVCRLKELGLVGIGANYTEISVKSLRTEAGGSEAEITFDFDSPGRTKTAVERPSEMIEEKDEAVDPTEVPPEQEPSAIKDLFGK